MKIVRAITVVMPFYSNPSMLVEHQRLWRALPDDLKAALHVIVVDDCSPTGPALPVIEPTGIASFRLYRTGVDVRWNWLFARNLGVDQAETQWVLLTDIDHAIPEETLRFLVTTGLNKHAVYRFSRVDAPAMTPYKIHPNSWLMTREMFDKIGGYDERFSGYYGTDGEFRDRVHAAAQKVILLAAPLIRYPREHIPDASTTTYGRKEEQDREAVPRIRAERENVIGWRPLRLTFPWERLV